MRKSLGIIIGLCAVSLVSWVVYRDWTLPRNPIDPKRIKSLTIFDGVARWSDQSDVEQMVRVQFEEDALKKTVQLAKLEAGGLSSKYPTWRATARLDDGTELRVSITHVGYFEIEGQRGVYELPKQPDLFLKAVETMKQLKELGKVTTQPVNDLN
jgi:hypothetical protein